MTPGNVAGPWFFTLTLTNSESRQFSTSTSGNVPVSNDSQTTFTHIHFWAPSLPRTMRPEHYFMCHAIARPAWLGDSVLGMWFEGDEPDPICVDIKETHVGPVCRQWNVCWFNLDAIWIQYG